MTSPALGAENWRERKRAVEAIAHSGDQAELRQLLVDTIGANHQDLGALNAVLQLLSLLKTPVGEELSRLLHDPDAEARMYAALALGELGDPQYIPTLLEALAQSPEAEADLNVRFNIIEALGKLKARQALGPLRSLLESSDFYLAYPILQALAEIGDASLTPTLLPYLGNSLLCVPAAEALGNSGDSSAIQPLVDWLESPQGEALAAATALCQIAGRAGEDEAGMTRMGQEIAGRISTQGWEKLASAIPAGEQEARHESLGPSYRDLATVFHWKLENEPGDFPELTTILNGLVSLLAHAEARKKAVEALAGAGERATPTLVRRLGDASLETCWLIMHILGESGGPAAIPALLPFLQSEEAETAFQAAEALGKIGETQAFEPLAQVWRHASPRVRRAATHALIRIGNAHPESNPDWMRRLQILMSDPEVRAREELVVLLGGLRPAGTDATGVRQMLLEALGDDHPAVRRAAVEGLSSHKEWGCPPAMERLIHDPDAGVRAACGRALAHCPVEEALPLLDTLLKDADERTRLAACRALGSHARPESLEALEGLIDDPSPMVRIRLAEALGKIGGRRARELVVRLAADPHIDVHQAVETARIFLDQGKAD